MPNQDYKTWIEIDTAALKNNAAVFKRLAGKAALLAMVKCNAYGHGSAEVSQALSRSAVDWFGVDTVDEGIALRRLGIKKPILVISFTPPQRLPLLVKYNLSQSVSAPSVILSMAKTRLRKKYKIHLKIDTGMSRQGIMHHDVAPALSALKQAAGAVEFEGLMTHFATSDEPGRRHFQEQQHNFAAVVKKFKQLNLLPKFVHSNNSAALLQTRQPDYLTMHRVGIGMYGLAPAPLLAAKIKRSSIKSVLSWKTRVIQIKTLPKGAAVGYGATERLRRRTTLAVLPVGYYEGLPRLYSSVGLVLIDGRPCRIVGRVSMNLCVVDITSVPKPPRVWADEAVIIGRQGKQEVTADMFAKATSTINYEVVTRINPLIPRVVV